MQASIDIFDLSCITRGDLGALMRGEDMKMSEIPKMVKFKEIVSRSRVSDQPSAVKAFLVTPSVFHLSSSIIAMTLFVVLCPRLGW